MFARTLLCLLLGVASAAAAVDFTPHVTEETSEGFTYRHVTVKVGDGTATFIAPLNWTIRGSKDAVEMASKADFTDATVQALPLTSATFEEPVVTRLLKTALASAPPTSQDVKLVSQRENPVVFGPRLSYEVVISYTTLGDTFYRSFVFVNLEDTQLVFRVSARKANFEKVNDAFRRSITSWQFLPGKGSSAEAPVNAALQ
jgi:hypothetical protein